MANGNREFRATIGYSYDAAGERAVVQGNERLKRSISGVTNELGELTGAARLAVAATRMRFENTQAELGILREQERLEDAVTASIQQQTAAIEQQASAISRRLAQAERVRATQEQSDSFVGGLRGDLLGGQTGGSAGGTTAGQRVSQIGRAIFNAPAVGPSTPIARVLQSSGPLIDKLGLSLGQVGALAGVAGVGLGVVAVALNRFNEGLEESKRRLDAALRAQDAFYNAVATLTSQDVRERIQQLELIRDAQRQQLEETRAAQEGAFENVQRLVGGQVTFVGDAFARLLDNQAGVGTLRERANELETQVNATNDEITRLTQGLDENAFAANDAAEAAERQAEATTRLVESLRNAADDLAELVRSNIAAQAEARAESIAGEFDFRRRAAELRRTGTQEQIDELRQLNVEEFQLNQQLIDQLQVLAPSSKTVAQEVERLIARQAELIFQNQLLASEVEPVVGARDREIAAAQALKDQTDEYFEALTNTTKAQQELLDAQQAYNDVLAESDARLVEIAANLAEREAEAAETRAERIEEVEERVGEQRAKRAEDLSKRIAKIERDFARSFTEAVGARDALAAEQAKQRRADALKDLQEGQTEQEKELEVSLQKQLKTIERNYEKQLDAARKAAEKSERQERARRDRELAIAQRAIDQADVQLRNAKNAELAIYQTHFANLNNTANAGLNTLVNTFGQGLLTMVQQIQAAFSRINPTVARAPIQYSSPIGPQRNTIGSGFIPVNSNPFVSANQSFGGSGRTTLNVNFNGASVRQVDVRSRQQATRVLEEFWDQVPLR